MSLCEKCNIIVTALRERVVVLRYAPSLRSGLPSVAGQVTGRKGDKERCPRLLILPTGERADDQDLSPKRINYWTGSDGRIHQLI